MRLITTLSLGAAALVCAGVPLAAQPVRAAAAEPAVRPLAAQTPRPGQKAPPAAVNDAAPTTDAAPLASPAAAAPAAAATAPTATAPAPSAALPSPDSNSIVATVNDTPISEYDLRQRIQLKLALSHATPSTDDLKRLRSETLQQLEEETLQRQVAVEKHITVSPVEVDKVVNQLLTQNKVTHEALRKTLSDAGSSEAALRDQYIASEVWRKVVQAEFSQDIASSITPAQIEDAVRREAEGATKTHYLVSEIFLAVDKPEDAEKVLKTMEDIEKQIRGGSPFPEVAKQYSRNPSAASGGDIGWVYDGQMDPDLNTAVSKLTRGDLSHPIRARGGYYLLGLRDRQEPLGTDVTTPEVMTPTGPPGTLPLARLLLPVGNANAEQMENISKTAMQIKENVASCAELVKVHDQLKGSVYNDLGDFKLADLSPEIQKALAETKSGEIAQPMRSEVGIEIIARCDKRAPPPRVAFTMPSRDEVESRLFTDRIAALARRYLRDLKRDANIQERGENGEIKDTALATH